MSQNKKYEAVEARLLRIETHVSLLEAVVLRLDKLISKFTVNEEIVGEDLRPPSPVEDATSGAVAGDGEEVRRGTTTVARQRTLF
jgi:hypothetical protein